MAGGFWFSAYFGGSAACIELIQSRFLINFLALIMFAVAMAILLPLILNGPDHERRDNESVLLFLAMVASWIPIIIFPNFWITPFPQFRGIPVVELALTAYSLLTCFFTTAMIKKLKQLPDLQPKL